ncbi:MAG TPA: RluA family pseudouridine synthase [Lachnospiraceae bacterium]|nr:RluA family pseudouridine synthase [Lachnospiraceae bacterium]
MKEIEIGKNGAGMRFDKYLKKVLKLAPSGFIYKMLRKKNITLDGRKAMGNELLSQGSKVQFFLSDETFKKFSEDGQERTFASHRLDILYEDEDIILINKESGMLVQQSNSKEDSISEFLVSYLLAEGGLNRTELASFRPSPVNRLDRNTSGIVLCGKTAEGLRFLSEVLRSRSLRKDYLVLAKGESGISGRRTAYLKKNAETNLVCITEDEIPGSEKIVTEFIPLSSSKGFTLYSAGLITGKTHQIRAHLSFLGYPVAGDPKYGNAAVNHELKAAYGLSRQFLHSYKVGFSEISKEKFGYMSGRVFCAPLPQDLKKVLNGLGFSAVF